MSDKNIMLFGCIYNLVNLWYVNGLLYGGEGNHCIYFATKKDAMKIMTNPKLRIIAKKNNYISMEDYKKTK